MNKVFFKALKLRSLEFLCSLFGPKVLWKETCKQYTVSRNNNVLISEGPDINGYKWTKLAMNKLV